MNDTKRHNIRRAMRIVAERRRCPECNRKSAMRMVTRTARWGERYRLKECRWCGHQSHMRLDDSTE